MSPRQRGGDCNTHIHKDPPALVCVRQHQKWPFLASSPQPGGPATVTGIQQDSKRKEARERYYTKAPTS